jgi:hypothetical protein
MATQWGRSVIASGQAQAWFFSRQITANFLPVISVVPLTPSNTDSNDFRFTGTGDYGFQGISFPICSQLGVSTMWSQINDYTSIVTYYILVMNFSNNAVEYAFVESDL